MDQSVIKINQAGKKFSKSLKQSMLYGISDILSGVTGCISDSTQLRKGEFWAVDDLSCELKSGKTLGIIGSNGSGKSTVLKMLNGIFMPDKGQINITGRVGALIEVGAGFHPLLSGRENVYINGAILGMTKKELDKKFDDIVNFADIGDFIDAPVKHYSSGMFVRLGFSVAIHCQPDILLVDEVLAVGDLAFAIKCHRKMSEFRQNGGTVVLVSHNMQAIRNICNQVLWLERGRKKLFGDVFAVCDAYENETIKASKNFIEEGQKQLNYDANTQIKSVEFVNNHGDVNSEYSLGNDLNMRIYYDFKRSVSHPIFTVTIYSPEGLLMTSSHSHTDGHVFKELSGEGFIEYTIKNINFRPAKYVCAVTVSEEEVANILDWHEKKYHFVLTGNIVNEGLVNPFPVWKHI